MAKHFFPLTGKPPCKTCGQPEGVKLDVGEAGFSVTTGFEHLEGCPALRCQHGILWQDDCATCAYEDALYGADADEG